MVSNKIEDMRGGLKSYVNDAARAGAKARKGTLQKLQQALQTAPVKPVKGGTLKKLAAKTGARRKKERIAGLVGGEEEEKEAAE